METIVGTGGAGRGEQFGREGLHLSGEEFAEFLVSKAGEASRELVLVLQDAYGAGMADPMALPSSYRYLRRYAESVREGVLSLLGLGPTLGAVEAVAQRLGLGPCEEFGLVLGPEGVGENAVWFDVVLREEAVAFSISSVTVDHAMRNGAVCVPVGEESISCKGALERERAQGASIAALAGNTGGEPLSDGMCYTQLFVPSERPRFGRRLGLDPTAASLREALVECVRDCPAVLVSGFDSFLLSGAGETRHLQGRGEGSSLLDRLAALPDGTRVGRVCLECSAERDYRCGYGDWTTERATVHVGLAEIFKYEDCSLGVIVDDGKVCVLPSGNVEATVQSLRNSCQTAMCPDHGELIVSCKCPLGKVLYPHPLNMVFHVQYGAPFSRIACTGKHVSAHEGAASLKGRELDSVESFTRARREPLLHYYPCDEGGLDALAVYQWLGPREAPRSAGDSQYLMGIMDQYRKTAWDALGARPTMEELLDSPKRWFTPRLPAVVTTRPGGWAYLPGTRGGHTALRATAVAAGTSFPPGSMGTFVKAGPEGVGWAIPMTSVSGELAPPERLGLVATDGSVKYYGTVVYDRSGSFGEHVDGYSWAWSHDGLMRGKARSAETAGDFEGGWYIFMRGSFKNQQTEVVSVHSPVACYFEGTTQLDDFAMEEVYRVECSVNFYPGAAVKLLCLEMDCCGFWNTWLGPPEVNEGDVIVPQVHSGRDGLSVASVKPPGGKAYVVVDSPGATAVVLSDKDDALAFGKIKFRGRGTVVLHAGPFNSTRYRINLRAGLAAVTRLVDLEAFGGWVSD